MKIGFIGAGRAGCSLGKYLSDHGHLWENTVVTGFYSLQKQDAKWAADFTASSYFADLKSVVDASNAIVISTPDRAIKTLWDTLQQYELRGKIVCHLSGSLSSDVFSDSGNLGVYPISIHPLFAFSDRESTHQQLHEVSFTLEGHDYALLSWERLFTALGNPTVRIQKEQKAKYHCAASLLSNHLLAILQTGYDLLAECGFTEEEARLFSASLVSGKTNIDAPLFVDTIPVVSAADMAKEVKSRADLQDIIIKAAAVADYRPSVVSQGKMKKKEGEINIPLERTEDILAGLGATKRSGQFLCGFSMETENMLENSREKLMRKNLDLIVANNLKQPGAGFGTDTNVVTLISKKETMELPLLSKEELANRLLDYILRNRSAIEH